MESQLRNELVTVLVQSEHVFWAQRLGVVDEDFWNPPSFIRKLWTDDYTKTHCFRQQQIWIVPLQDRETLSRDVALCMCVYVCVCLLIHLRNTCFHSYKFVAFVCVCVWCMSYIRQQFQLSTFGQTAGSGEQSSLNDPPVNVILLDISLPPV